MVVVSLSMVTFSAVPNISTVAFSSLKPRSSLITVPPVKMAMSSNMALRRSPNPGAFTAATRRAPRILFTTKVASASPSTSSAMINKGRPDCATGSNTGRISFMLDTFLS